MIYGGIELSTLKDEEVLFFIRIRGKDSYFKEVYSERFLEEFSSLKKFRTISEYRKDAEIYIDLKKYTSAGLSQKEMELIDICVDELDVIRRCRGLRCISYIEARDLIVRASRFFINLFEEERIKLLVIGAVDNYVMDIMERFARYFGVVVLGVTGSFLAPKYKLVTVRGESNKFYQPTADEVDQVLNDIRTKAKSALAVSKSAAIKSAARNFFSYWYRFLARYIYGYCICGNISYEYRFAPFFQMFWSPHQLLALKYLKSIKALSDVDAERCVYIPLHYFPEATIDYWVSYSRDADYLESLLRVVDYHNQKGVTVILKEHPAFYLARPIKFYKELKKRNVIIISPFVATREIVENVKRIVVWTGSTGIEALLQDADVKIVTENYYSRGKLKFYHEDGASNLDSKEQWNLVEHVLTSSVRI